MGKRVKMRYGNVQAVSLNNPVTRLDVLVHELALLISMSCRAEVWRIQKANGEV